MLGDVWQAMLPYKTSATVYSGDWTPLHHGVSTALDHFSTQIADFRNVRIGLDILPRQTEEEEEARRERPEKERGDVYIPATYNVV